jgi:hypothetical protein
MPLEWPSLSKPHALGRRIEPTRFPVSEVINTSTWRSAHRDLRFVIGRSLI